MGKKSKTTSNKKDDRKADKKGALAASGAKAIGRAEKRLEKALGRLDDVRAELAASEAALRDLLIKHGRMPADEPPAVSDEASTQQLLDQQQVVYPLDGSEGNDFSTDDATVSVPLLDQRQVLDVGSREPVNRDE